MPYARKNVTDLRTEQLAFIQARLFGSNPFLRRAVLNVLGIVTADQHNDELGYLDWISKQAVPWTATGEYLAGWGALRSVQYKDGTFAAVTASITGAIPDAVIPGFSAMTRADGFGYLTSGDDVTVADDGTATLNLAARLMGSIGNCDNGTTLTFVSAPEGVPQTATVASTTNEGTDLETDPAFKSRVLQAFALPPQGGDLNDYQTWALATPPVTRAWAGGSQISGSGSVTVYFMIDDAAHANGIPTGTNGVSQYDPRAAAAVGDQLALANALFSKRPVTALVYACAPIADTIDVALQEVPADATIRADIAAALAALLIRKATPGGVVLPDLTSGGTIRVSDIEDAIAAVPGLPYFLMTAPTADFVSSTGHIAAAFSIAYSNPS